MRRYTLSNAAILSLYFVVGQEKYLEAQVPVEIIGVPSAADSVFVLADGDELTSPLEAFARLQQSMPVVRLSLPSVKPQSLRIRAVSFGGASLLPTVTAIGATTFLAGQGVPARIRLTWPTPLIEKLTEAADGSTTFCSHVHWDRLLSHWRSRRVVGQRLESFPKL
jgi:hypothetical protein